MSRYISVDDMRAIFCQSKSLTQAWDGFDKAPTIDIPQWILCIEELPKKYERVLTTSKHGQVRENFLTIHDWSFDAYNVIAWMPLPEPYKENNDE